MKIYIVHEYLLDEIDKTFDKLTDEEVINICNNDTLNEWHDVYESVDELSAYWNTTELFYPSSSFMRVIND